MSADCQGFLGFEDSPVSRRDESSMASGGGGLFSTAAEREFYRRFFDGFSEPMQHGG